MLRTLLTLTFILVGAFYIHAQKISGKILDEKGEAIFGANVVIKGTTIGTTTDFDGKFVLNGASLEFPQTLQASFIGYKTKEIELAEARQGIEVVLAEDAEMLGEVSVVELRLSKQQQNSALTVEAMDAMAIKETPAVSFYEGLGNLKGVDLTSASIGFKVINTRGFNSTSPVRSLQIIDGVDNQAPGLNFSLGNFLGASELDVANVDIIAGASTAFYGPGAFNGVISMTTKDPFLYQGLSASVKVGERALAETAVRYAEAFKLFGADYENFAFKINLYYLRANDWEATNYGPIDDSEVPADNPGGYDAVNIYGDENLAGGNNFDNLANVLDFPSYAGLGRFYRTGYKEIDLVDYDTRNIKSGINLSYKTPNDIQIGYTLNYGTGTTVYQGENRFSLKDIRFWQNILEIKRENDFYIRAYSTNEDAGNSYDAVLTAFKMNEAIASNSDWNGAYSFAWRRDLKYGDSTLNLTGYPSEYPDLTIQEWFDGPYRDTLAKYNSLMQTLHGETRNVVDNSLGRPQPGTVAYDSLFNYITSRTFTQGGSRFYDRSSLYHIMGEKMIELNDQYTLRMGGNYRLYRPDSRGNIFDEITDTTITLDSAGEEIGRDYSYRQISNWEFGVYAGLRAQYMEERLKFNATVRMDKNVNFDYLISPAFSVSYDINEKHMIRFSIGKAIRNPTLQDQYLRYDVGRAILLGNLNGYDSLVTLESFDHYRNSLDRDTVEYFNVAPIRPEEVITAEIGYRGSLFNKVFVDANVYRNWYTNFIGFQFGLDFDFFSATSNFFDPQTFQAYRISANAPEQVVTTGANIGINYYHTEHLSLNGNYSYNVIDLQGSDNPIIPAYNTPEHKFNISLTGRNYKLIKDQDHITGFNITYKWVEGFRFEGSPQFTGFIPSYGLLDAQISYSVPDLNSTFKLGASNLLNNEVAQVYGGPLVGRLAYFSILFELN